MVYKNRTLLFTIIFVMTSLVIGIQAFFLFQNTQKAIIAEIGNNAKNTAVSIATFLESDIDNYEKLIRPDGSYDEDYYNKMLVIFQKLKAETGADFIYTAKYISENQMEYILDGENPTDPKFSPIGERDSIEMLQLVAFQKGIPTASGIVHQERWGYYLTGYAPIKNPDGSVISLVNVDISLESIREIIMGMIIFVVIGSGILSFLLSFLIYKLVNQRQLIKSFDYLTNLYSRSYFETALARLIRQKSKEQKSLSLLMIDIDHFKGINDQFGHQCGDKVLKAVAQVLKQCTRNEDICARFAGDEFVVLLPSSGKSEAVMVCERIGNTIRELQIVSEANEIIQLTLSIGLAEWVAGMTPADLMEAADNKLYVSKNEGKNRYTA